MVNKLRFKNEFFHLSGIVEVSRIPSVRIDKMTKRAEEKFE